MRHAFALDTLSNMSSQPPRTGSPSIQIEPPATQTSPGNGGISSSRNAGSSSAISQLMSPPSKSPATMALSPQLTAETPTPSSSRAHSLRSSVSHQSSNTFSAADAARHLSQEHVAKTSQDMFRKLAEYLSSEMLATGEDYKLLENMNNLTKERYSELAVVAQELMQEVGKLRTTYSDFEPYLARIDEISEQADMISNIAVELDEYTKSLESRLKRALK